jgi:hypothetical protein
MECPKNWGTRSGSLCSTAEEDHLFTRDAGIGGVTGKNGVMFKQIVASAPEDLYAQIRYTLIPCFSMR